MTVDEYVATEKGTLLLWDNPLHAKGTLLCFVPASMGPPQVDDTGRARVYCVDITPQQYVWAHTHSLRVASAAELLDRLVGE